MKHYKTPTGEVWAFEADGSQDHLIKPDMLRMTPAEVIEHLTPKPADIAKQEAHAIESQLTTLMLAEAVISGDMKPLKALVDKIKAAKAKL